MTHSDSSDGDRPAAGSCTWTRSTHGWQRFDGQQPRKSSPRFAYNGLELNTHGSNPAVGAPLIRILQVHPNVTEEGLIQCQLSCTRLLTSHTALSYTWGSEVPRFTVQINGKAFVVRRNLCESLKVARHKYTSLALWIDAICINQESLDERNDQVGFMAAIYQQAKQTIIWLGNGDGEVESALLKLTRTPHSDLPQQLLVTAEEGELATADAEDAHRLLQEHLLSEVWRVIVKLGNLPYWSQTWVIQEYKLSGARKLVYGNIEVPERCVSKLFTEVNLQAEGIAMSAPRIEIEKVRTERLTLLFHAPIQKLCTEATLLSTAERAPQDLRSVYMRYEQSECSDYQDRIYALRALITEGTTFSVDYSPSRIESALSVLNFCMRDLERTVLDGPEALDTGFLLHKYYMFAETIYHDFSINAEIQASGELLRIIQMKSPSILKVPRLSGVELDLSDDIEFTSFTGLTEAIDQGAREQLGWRSAQDLSYGLGLRSKDGWTVAPETLYLSKRQRLILLACGATVVAYVQFNRCHDEDHGPVCYVPRFIECGTEFGGLPGVHMSKRHSAGNSKRAAAKLVIEDSIAGVLLFLLPWTTFVGGHALESWPTTW